MVCRTYRIDQLDQTFQRIFHSEAPTYSAGVKTTNIEAANREPQHCNFMNVTSQNFALGKKRGSADRLLPQRGDGAPKEMRNTRRSNPFDWH